VAVREDEVAARTEPHRPVLEPGRLAFGAVDAIRMAATMTPTRTDAPRMLRNLELYAVAPECGQNLKTTPAVPSACQTTSVWKPTRHVPEKEEQANSPTSASTNVV